MRTLERLALHGLELPGDSLQALACSDELRPRLQRILLDRDASQPGALDALVAGGFFREATLDAAANLDELRCQPR